MSNIVVDSPTRIHTNLHKFFSSPRFLRGEVKISGDVTPNVTPGSASINRIHPPSYQRMTSNDSSKSSDKDSSGATKSSDWLLEPSTPVAPRRGIATASLATPKFINPADALNASGKRRRLPDTTSTHPIVQAIKKPPLPPTKKETRCCSVDRILDSPVKKSARLMEAGVEGIPEQPQRKTKSVDDLLDDPPTIAITDHSNDEQSQSPSPERDSDTTTTRSSPTKTTEPKMKMVVEAATAAEPCSLSKQCPAHNQSRRSPSVLSTDESIHSTDSGIDPAKKKHFLGKYVRRMKDILKK